LSYYPGICLQILDRDTKSLVMIAGIPAGIRTDTSLIRVHSVIAISKSQCLSPTNVTATNMATLLVGGYRKVLSREGCNSSREMWKGSIHGTSVGGPSTALAQ
jgi:hypothetical protein